jgi:hypothetical protein
MLETCFNTSAYFTHFTSGVSPDISPSEKTAAEWNAGGNPELDIPTAKDSFKPALQKFWPETYLAPRY